MSALRRFLYLVSLAGPRLFLKTSVGLVRMYWRYFLIGRGRGLYRLLKLETPMKLYIDTSSGCNFACFFCPQGAGNDPAFKTGTMKAETFARIVEGMKGFPRRVDEVIIGTYGEPLLNKRLPEMIRLMRSANVAREIGVTTNAALLDAETSSALIEAGLQKIRISIEALDDEGYLKVAQVKQSFPALVAQLAHFYKLSRGRCFVYIKIVDLGMSESDKRKFFRTFAPIADCVGIENLIPITKPAAKLVGAKLISLTGVGKGKNRKVCPSPFYSMSLHFDGQVAVCCSDWRRAALVGNAAEKPLHEIWNGQPMKDFRLDMLTKGWTKMDACRGCSTVKTYPPYEDLDAHAATLTEKYS